jgi:O-antigen/teichoic acid export membrane protein
MIKKLFSHSLIYGLAPQVPRIVGVFTLPIITAHLTKLDFGVYGLITAVAASLESLNTLGLNLILANFFYKSPGQFKWAWRQIYGFLILWNIPYALVLAAVIWFFIPQEAAGNTWQIVALNVLPIVFFGPTSVLGSLFYQLSGKPLQIGIRSALIGLVTVALNIFFIAKLEWGYMGWFTSYCIAQMLYHISYFFPLMYRLKITPIFNFKRRFMKRQLAISIPAVFHSYGYYFLNTSDRVIMKLVGINTGDIGLYNTSGTVSGVIQSGLGATGDAASPMLLSAYRNKEEKGARKIIFILQTGFLALTFVLSIWMKEIFRLLISNEQLRTVFPVAIILVMAYNYRPMYFGANSRLFYQEKTKTLLKVTFTAGIISVALNFCLLPFFGYQAAAYTSFAALMYMGFAGYFFRVFRENCPIDYYPLRWLGGIILLTAAASFLVYANIWIKVAITVAVILSSVFALWWIEKNGEHGSGLSIRKRKLSLISQ